MEGALTNLASVMRHDLLLNRPKRLCLEKLHHLVDPTSSTQALVAHALETHRPAQAVDDEEETPQTLLGPGSRSPQKDAGLGLGIVLHIYGRFQYHISSEPAPSKAILGL